MLTASHLTRAPVWTDHTALENFWESVAAGYDSVGDIHGDGTQVTTWRNVIPIVGSTRRGRCAIMNTIFQNKLTVMKGFVTA
jgi:hypothetical protein